MLYQTVVTKNTEQQQVVIEKKTQILLKWQLQYRNKRTTETAGLDLEVNISYRRFTMAVFDKRVLFFT